MPKSKKKKQPRLQRLRKKVIAFCRKYIWPVLYVAFIVMNKIVENYDNLKSIAKDILG